ncbi:MAG: cation:proton antiporter, partial [Chitinophagaceae bacterium]|nr:cation:proton antiporter [Chitinophagaceae bacterium]
AFLIVILTSCVIAFVSSSLIPGFTLALGFLLGGIISPPDAVSATSIMKQIKVPRRLVTIVEGESLLNDAASLIVFRFALAAVDSGEFI